MMEINVHNYEAFLLDEAEGRLNAAQSAALRSFLLAHPHLGAEPVEDLPVLDPSQEHFPFVQSLLKDEPGAREQLVLSYLEGLQDEAARRNFENQLRSDQDLRRVTEQYKKVVLSPPNETMGSSQWLRHDLPSATEELVLRYTEGLMTAQEALQFEKENAAQLAQLIRTYTACRFTADHQVVFPGKASLFRSAKIIGLKTSLLYSRVAAAVVLLAMLTVLLWPSAEPSPAVVSQKAEAPVTKPAAPQIVPAHPLPPATLQVAEAGVTKKKDPLPRITENREVIAQTVPEQELVAEVPPAVVEQHAPGKITEEPAANKAEPLTVVSDLRQLAWAEDMPDKEGQGSGRKKFWEKTAGVLGQLKKLGVKGVDASEQERGVTLSINALSVEKKYAGL